jgi:hypothetical protein
VFGYVKNASRKAENAIEPPDLMMEAAAVALKDTALSESNRLSLRSAIDAISVVTN